MKNVACIRISTGGQDLNNQRLAILDYAHRHRLQIDEFLEVQASSRRLLKERDFDGRFAGMQAGDLILVSELSRLWRSVGQIIQTVDDLVKHHIRFVAIKENIELEGRQDIQSMVTAKMFGLFAEIERDLISERARGFGGCTRGRARTRSPERLAREIPSRWQGFGNSHAAWQESIEGSDCQDHGLVAVSDVALFPIARIGNSIRHVCSRFRRGKL